jgi:fucose permease
MTLLQPMMVAALLVTGMGVALLGSVKVPLARRLQIDEARVGGLVSVFGFTMIPVIFTAGFLTDLVGRQMVMVAGSALMAVSLLALGRARGYAAAFTAVVLMSASWAMMINVGNVLTPVAFPGTTEAYSTNLANVFFGLGAFLTPLALTALVSRLALPPALALVACLALAPGLLTLALEPGQVRGADRLQVSPRGVARTVGVAADPLGAGPYLAAATFAAPERPTNLFDPVLLLCGLALFFYGPLEASLGAWTTTYLGERGVPEPQAARLLSAFWLTFMGARLLAAFTLPAGKETLVILALALAAVLVLLGLVRSRSRSAAVAAVVGAGLVFGPIFPTLMAVLLGHFDASVHGRAVGLFFAIGGVGWTVIPILIGIYAQRTSIQRGLTVAVGAGAGLCAVALILLLR